MPVVASAVASAAGDRAGLARGICVLGGAGPRRTVAEDRRWPRAHCRPPSVAVPTPGGEPSATLRWRRRAAHAAAPQADSESRPGGAVEPAKRLACPPAGAPARLLVHRMVLRRPPTRLAWPTRSPSRRRRPPPPPGTPRVTVSTVRGSRGGRRLAACCATGFPHEVRRSGMGNGRVVTEGGGAHVSMAPTARRPRVWTAGKGEMTGVGGSGRRFARGMAVCRIVSQQRAGTRRGVCSGEAWRMMGVLYKERMPVESATHCTNPLRTSPAVSARSVRQGPSPGRDAGTVRQGRCLLGARLGQCTAATLRAAGPTASRGRLQGKVRPAAYPSDATRMTPPVRDSEVQESGASVTGFTAARAITLV